MDLDRRPSPFSDATTFELPRAETPVNRNASATRQLALTLMERTSNLRDVEEALRSGADPNIRLPVKVHSRPGQTHKVSLISFCVLTHPGSPEYIDILFRYGADVSAENYQALKMAARFSTSAVFLRLTQAVSTQMTHVAYEQLMSETLVIASTKGRIENMAIALDRGADVHFQNDAALVNAVVQNSGAAVQYLLYHGANVNARNHMMMVTACERGNDEIVRLLFRHGASLNDPMLRPPLVETIVHDRWSTFLLLISLGADLRVFNDCPLVIASHLGRVRYIRVLVNLQEREEALISYGLPIKNMQLNGANVQAYDELALKEAVRRGDAQLVEYLLSTGADVLQIPIPPDKHILVYQEIMVERYNLLIEDESYVLGPRISNYDLEVIPLLVDVANFTSTPFDVITMAFLDEVHFKEHTFERSRFLRRMLAVPQEYYRILHFMCLKNMEWPLSVLFDVHPELTNYHEYLRKKMPLINALTVSHWLDAVRAGSGRMAT